MQHAPDWAAVLTAWQLSPVTDLLVLVGTVGHLRLAHRARQSPAGWPRRRPACWLGAMLVVVLAMNSPITHFAELLFWVHMVQHLLLIMVVPVLLVWAQPIRLLGAAGGPRSTALLRAVSGSPALRWSGWPVAGLLLYSAVVVLTHLTGFQQASETHGWLRGTELAAFFVVGCLYFLPLVGAEREPWSLPYLFRFVLLAAGMGADTLTGVTLMMTGHPIAPAYAATHPGWGPTALADQELAGAIMWFGGDLLMMLLMIVTAVQWGRAAGDRQGLGNWLEGARRRALLGAGSDDDYGSETELDDDQRALDAYNATLAALHGRQHDQPHGQPGEEPRGESRSGEDRR